MRRSYSGGAQPARLTVTLGGSINDLTIYCNDLANWPDGSGDHPFYVVIDRGNGSEEKILCESRTGNTLTVWADGLDTGRAADGTSVSSHSVNAVIEHCFTAVDANEANQHVNTDVLHLQTVTSSTHPASPADGQMIYETDTNRYYGWKSSVWAQLGGGATGGGNNDIFYENSQIVTENYTITAGKNASSAGPITVATGVTVTIPSNSVWTII